MADQDFFDLRTLVTRLTFFSASPLPSVLTTRPSVPVLSLLSAKNLHVEAYVRQNLNEGQSPISLIMKTALFAATLFSVLLPALAAPSPTVAAEATGPTQIRTDQDPVYHFYLQESGGAPILGPEASASNFTVGSTVEMSGATLFLNVNMNVTTSYKPLTLDSTAKTTTWTMSGDTIVASGQQNFVVCPMTGSSNFNLFLQTGDDMPSTACTDWITIHLPCLC